MIQHRPHKCRIRIKALYIFVRLTNFPTWLSSVFPRKPQCRASDRDSLRFYPRKSIEPQSLRVPIPLDFVSSPERAAYSQLLSVLTLGNAMVMFYMTQGLGFTWARVWDYITTVDGWRSGQAATVVCAWIQVFGNVKWNSRAWLVGGFLSSIYTSIYSFILLDSLKYVTASSEQISGAAFIYLVNSALNILAFAVFVCIIAEQFFPASYLASARASAWHYITHTSVANAQCFWIEQSQLTPRAHGMSPANEQSKYNVSANVNAKVESVDANVSVDANIDRLLFRCNSRVLAAVLFTLFLTLIVAVSFSTAFSAITIDPDLARFLEAKGVSMSDQQDILATATHGVVLGFVAGWLGVVAMQALLLRSFRRDLVSALHCEPTQAQSGQRED